MLRKVIITINPMYDDPPAGSPASSSHSPSGDAAAVRHRGAELLMYPEPFRSIAEGRVGIAARENK
jgi:hypothetical protein